METTFQSEFIQNCKYRLQESLRMIKICYSDLAEDQIWQKPNENSNSIANQTLHLCGNLRQYAIASLSEGKDERIRDLEFSTSGGYAKAELLSKLESTIEEVFKIADSIPPESWLKIRSVQGFKFSGVGVLLHAVEHLSYHTGQIALITKLYKNRPLGFYDGFDLNTKNDES